MSRLPAIVFGALTLCTISLVRADAPAGQYLPFDGSDTTVTDAYTKLTWSRAVLGPATFVGVQGLCLGGTRVPTLKELLTIVDESPHNYEFDKGANPYKYIDGSAFRGTPINDAFWTVTPTSKTGAIVNKAYTVNFATGGVVEALIAEPHYVRCVK
jgi:hypothetical protein